MCDSIHARAGWASGSCLAPSQGASPVTAEPRHHLADSEDQSCPANWSGRPCQHLDALPSRPSNCHARPAQP